MKTSYLWAVLILVAVGIWLGSPYFDFKTMAAKPPAETPASEQASAGQKPEKLFRVRVKTYSAEPREVSVTVRGRTKASRRVEARARTQGIVVSSPLREGDKVKLGDIMCTLDVAERQAQLAEAKSNLASTVRDYEATSSLSKKKFASAAKVASDKARVEAAQARVDQILREIEYTKITAPMSGIVEARPAEKGSFLQVGATCATLIDLNPIIVSAMVSERDIKFLSSGMPAKANLVTGQKIPGKIRYIAAKADIRTRTFEVEMEAENPGKKIRDGLTSELIIPLTAGTAHKLPTSALTLRDTGEIGVSILASGNKVKFLPTKILGFDREDVWVSGLPDPAPVITVGQDYVLEGQTVDPVHGTDAKTAEIRQ
ncbi:MAG: efflux RND transporter periplasmic adaptor subunit [Rhizobiales bacterium]|nr:efflux RND transporter periplasmic adaptor subunit [Hyphomicrobiales bacterium]